jgi:GT2 family glycosyltransferase
VHKIVDENSNAVLIDVPNNGYSYGNNRGIEYSINNYLFKYLIISNPDIEIKKFNLPKENLQSVIYGPVIKTLSGKDQNPFRPIVTKTGERFQYQMNKKRNYRLLTFRKGANKILRELFLARFLRERSDQKQVYSLHGSFVIFTYDAILKLGKIYYEKMFLFGEEELLSYRCKKHGIPMIMTKDVEVLHKEDGSMKLANIKTLDQEAKSYIIYYEERDKADKESSNFYSK